ncbi:MAG: pectate lyase [Planctomycetota bacterium]
MFQSSKTLAHLSMGRLQAILSVALLAAPVLTALSATAVAQPSLRDEALATAKGAVKFLQQEVSTRGGYLWRYSADLSQREGEGVVVSETVWTQPPGTPTVGEAFLDLYAATQDPLFLNAAQAAGEALRQGQMLSGGWQASVEFEPERRAKWAYRTNAKQHRRAKDQSSLDDDKTQASLRFIIRLDSALMMMDEQVHEMALFALEGLLTKGQFPNGGFPQVFGSNLKNSAHTQVHPNARARYPAAWSREYQGHQEYWYRLTLNDNLAPDLFDALFLAYETYQDERYRAAAIKLADFLLLAQLPEPQPAWAQQYNYDMEPIWARKFEPAAVTGGESQGVIRTLLSIYRKTGEPKYLEPIPRTIAFLKRSQLADGRLARFYELQTNRPLYFTKDYKVTYDDSDMPTHYAFQVSNSVASLEREYEKLLSLSKEELATSQKRISRASQQEVQQIVSEVDERGIWLSAMDMRYHKSPGPVIDMRETVKKLKLLAAYLQND